jgi:hypothetical protein
VKDFSSRYAESDGTMHGAYGHRWRYHFEKDQLIAVSAMLRFDPTTRRAVLGMWDPSIDLGIDHKDIPCNTHIYFAVRKRQGQPSVVDMTVCCRSNDIIWGAYGANAVHMAVMGQVVAGLAGLELGVYYQISNNYHAYTNVLSKLPRVKRLDNPYRQLGHIVPVIDGNDPASRITDAVFVLNDVDTFMVAPNASLRDFESNFFRLVVHPMHTVHKIWKSGDTELAIDKLQLVRSRDWREAARAWILRRRKK